MDDMVDNGYDDVNEIVSDEPFIGGVDSVSNDEGGGDNDMEFVSIHQHSVTSVPKFTAFIGNASPPAKRRGRPLKPESERMAALAGSLTPQPPKRKGRPPKAESEKRKQAAQPKGAIRISLTPKVKGPRGRPPRNSTNVTPAGLLTASGDGSLASPFPVVQINNVARKSPGRPRIHPPKDPTVKKPRGRPRTVPLEGEKAWRAECAKLRRLVNKKDELITRMKQKLKELGVTLEDPPKTASDSDNNEYSCDANGSGGGVEVDAGIAAIETVPCTMENTHQKYLDLFAAADNYSNSSDNDDDDERENDEDAEDDDGDDNVGRVHKDDDEDDDDDDGDDVN